MTIHEPNTIQINGEQTPYIFDRVFGPETTQTTVYEYVGHQTVFDVLNGYNGTIFTYGQTNSGKTYTMFGDDIDSDEIKGIIPRTGAQIFEHIEQAGGDIVFEIKCSLLEIYKEKLRDLLNRDKNDLGIKESPTKGIFVEGLTEFWVSNLDEMLEVVAVGQETREIGSTRLNNKSSRSHTIFIMNISQKYPDGTEKRGLLNLVDLAGSENVSKSGAEGKTLEEAKKINKSLSALCNVIHALTSSCEHIPYRDSKLTRILQESLGGNFKTTLIIACSLHASHIQESIYSLKFGRRTKAVKNVAKMNISGKNENYQLVINSLRQELEVARKEIRHLKSGSEDKIPINYPLEILIDPLSAQENDSLRAVIERYKDEIDSLKSENQDLKVMLKEKECENVKIKNERFAFERRCMEYEQSMNIKKLVELKKDFNEEQSTLENSILKKEVGSLSDALNEMEGELYKSLREKQIKLPIAMNVLRPQIDNYLGKEIVEPREDKKSFISAVDIQKQFENDRQLMRDIVSIPIDEIEMLKTNKYANQLLGSIEGSRVSKDMIMHLLKNNVIDLVIYNHSLQRVMTSMQWKQIIEMSKAKARHELYILMEKLLKEVEDMLGNSHTTQSKLLKYIDKMHSSNSNEKNTNQAIPSYKSKIKKSASKYSVHLHNNFQSSKNLSAFMPCALQRILIIKIL